MQLIDNVLSCLVRLVGGTTLLACLLTHLGIFLYLKSFVLTQVKQVPDWDSEEPLFSLPIDHMTDLQNCSSFASSMSTSHCSQSANPPHGM